MLDGHQRPGFFNAIIQYSGSLEKFTSLKRLSLKICVFGLPEGEECTA
jgi:hypothetical protein